MGAGYIAGMLSHPIALLLGVGLLFVISSAQYDRPGLQPISARQLPWGYVAALAACAAIAAASSHISEAEALSKWKVPAEDYWRVQVNTFLSLFVPLGFVALIGIAAIGLPITRMLHRRGLATVPWVLLCSVPVSVVVAVWISLLEHPRFRHLGDHLKYVVATHLVISLAFCVGARLAWRARTKL
jgi:ABC-type sugar transport system permease subunit